MNLSGAIAHCKGRAAESSEIDYGRLASWLQELKIRRTLGAATICNVEFPLLDENEIERDKFISKYVERDPVPAV